MAEISHPVFGRSAFDRYDPEIICECGHPRKYHNPMGLSENLLAGTNCNTCQCQEFNKSAQNSQNKIIRLRKEIEVHKKEVEGVLASIDNELTQLQERCLHPTQKSQLEYDFTAYWCNDCGKQWSSRR